MHLLALLLNPGTIGTLALFLAVLWMLRDESDRTSPILVFALALNLLFGFLMTVLMAGESSLLPLKYDHVLFLMDDSMGVSAASIARPLQGAFRFPLVVVYQLMVPMMICWFLVTRYRNGPDPWCWLMLPSWFADRSGTRYCRHAGPFMPLARSGFIP